MAAVRGKKLHLKDVKFRRWCSDLSKIGDTVFLAQEVYQSERMPQQHYFLQVVTKSRIGEVLQQQFSQCPKYFIEARSREYSFLLSSIQTQKKPNKGKSLKSKNIQNKRVLIF